MKLIAIFIALLTSGKCWAASAFDPGAAADTVLSMNFTQGQYARLENALKTVEQSAANNKSQQLIDLLSGYEFDPFDQQILTTCGKVLVGRFAAFHLIKKLFEGNEQAMSQILSILSDILVTNSDGNPKEREYKLKNKYLSFTELNGMKSTQAKSKKVDIFAEATHKFDAYGHIFCGTKQYKNSGGNKIATIGGLHFFPRLIELIRNRQIELVKMELPQGGVVNLILKVKGDSQAFKKTMSYVISGKNIIKEMMQCYSEPVTSNELKGAGYESKKVDQNDDVAALAGIEPRVVTAYIDGKPREYNIKYNIVRKHDTRTYPLRSFYPYVPELGKNKETIVAASNDPDEGEFEHADSYEVDEDDTDE